MAPLFDSKGHPIMTLDANLNCDLLRGAGEIAGEITGKIAGDGQ